MKTKGSKSAPKSQTTRMVTKGRAKKPAPTVASPQADVPEWAERAASRDTAAEMAAVPEATAVFEPPPVTKKGRAAKLGAAKPVASIEAPTATPGSLRAIGDAWLASLRAAGHTPSTLSSYAADLAIAYEHLGAAKAAAEITEKQIAGFDASALVLKKKNGKPKAKPTILKTRRALRLALVWAAAHKLISKAPYSAA